MGKTESAKPATTILELVPVAVFFLAYFWLKDEVFLVNGTEYGGFIAATAIFIPVLLASTAIIWWMTGRLSRMQVVVAVMVIVFGTLSIAFNDEAFFKFKPTMVYLIFAGILAVGLLRGKSPLRYVLDEAIPMQDKGWTIITRRMALFFLLMAVLNEVVWRTMSTDIWVNFKTFGIPVLTFVFFAVQYPVMQRFGLAEASGDE